MTGFGAAEGAVAGGRLRIEIRTVNHRFFNFAPKLPNELTAVEGELRERVRKDLDRGHVALSARWTEYPEREATLAIDLPRAEAAASRLRELKSALNLSGEVTLELVARQPEVLVSRSGEATRDRVRRGRADRGARGGGVPCHARAGGRGARRRPAGAARRA